MDVQDPTDKPDWLKDESLRDGFYPNALGKASALSGAGGNTYKKRYTVIVRVTRAAFYGQNEDDVQAAIARIDETIAEGQARDLRFLREPLAALKYIWSSAVRAAHATRQALLKHAPNALTETVLGMLVNVDELTPEEELERQDALAFIHREINKLKEKLREPLKLRFFQGMEYEAIGQQLNIDKATANRRVARALKLLREPFMAYIRGDV